MTGAGELWILAGLTVLGQFSPGPDMLLLTRAALREGPKVGAKMVLGIATGLAVHSTVAVVGLAVMYQRFPLFRRALLWIAALYLIWLAQGLLRSAVVSFRTGRSGEIQENTSLRSPFLRGLLCNLFNPKVALFLAAVCAPFLAGDHPVWWPAAIWGIIVGLGMFLWLLWVLLLQLRPLRLGYQRAGGWIDGVFGVALMALAIRLMVG